MGVYSLIYLTINIPRRRVELSEMFPHKDADFFPLIDDTEIDDDLEELLERHVVYASWEMGCCGTPFCVGDFVEWVVLEYGELYHLSPSFEADKLYCQKYKIKSYDYIHEAHSEWGKREMFVISGNVAKITLLNKKLSSVKKTIGHDEDDFVVIIKEAKIRPATKADVAKVYP